ncbi:MAG: SPOR domain-containing protein [Bacteroidales bacterium]|jgi:cell division protein FtsN
MNKIWFLGIVVCMIAALNSCKSKQSTYKAAYEQAQQTAPIDEEDLMDDELYPEPKTENENSGIATRQERISPFGDDRSVSLKRFNVVIGSFRNRTNATALKERMQGDGYNAVTAENETGMLRVIVWSGDSKADAANFRDKLKSKYYPNFQDAWILERFF